ncbi:MAG: hypothetical protein US76_03385 [Parcubacteria group bacterium GW2011_GWA2_38_13b]|nr:MAG: hypothetical protein US76_03385 [Parcubacteria group bacterium GW2011_GWA2_38_13b]
MKKREVFKAVPPNEAIVKPHQFTGEYEQDDEHLIKDKDGTYKVIVSNKLVPGTLKDLDGADEAQYFDEFNKESGEREGYGDICNFICNDCNKLKSGECREERVVCKDCGKESEMIYYRKKTEKGDTLFRKPFSLKEKR